MLLYIAGPMTGIEEMNFPAFIEAERQLREAGYEVLSPHQHGAGEPGMTWADYMRLDIPMMLTCQGIALLPDWHHSRGARLEVHIAERLEMPTKPLAEWLEERGNHGPD